MKFSDVAQADWEQLRPYVDTCLLPVTGLSGMEPPWEATRALEELRDALDCLELPYKGRVLTYPAFHFTGPQESGSMLKQVCANLKENGFPFVIVVGAKPELVELLCEAGADLAFVLTPERLSGSLTEVKGEIAEKLQLLWSRGD